MKNELAYENKTVKFYMDYKLEFLQLIFSEL